MHLHVLPQGAGVRVGLVAAAHFAIIGLVAGVDMGVLFPVAAVSEASVAAIKFTFEGLLTCSGTAMTHIRKCFHIYPKPLCSIANIEVLSNMISSNILG